MPHVKSKVEPVARKANHKTARPVGSSTARHPVLELQRSGGNQIAQRLIRSTLIQAKLQVSTPEDPSEREADRVADTVMRMAQPTVSRQQVQQATDQVEKDDHIVARKSKPHIPVAVREDDEEEETTVHRVCDECEEEMVQPKSFGGQLQLSRKTTDATGPTTTPSVSANIHAMKGRGSPLPAATRAFFEPRFGTDFSDIRLHTDKRAADTAKSIKAKAFTVGRDIVFAAGQYAPESGETNRLLAHELTHTIQQRPGSTSGAPINLRVSHHSDSAEQEASAAARAVLAGGNFSVLTNSSVMLSRQDENETPEQAQTRQAEVEMAAREMTSVLSSINVVGAEVEFLFWTSHGAITLVNFRRTQQGTRVVPAFTGDVLDAFTASELRVLPTIFGTGERYVQLTMHRTTTTWQQSSFQTPQAAPARPPEGRTIPISRHGYGETFLRSLEVANEIVRQLRVPRNATAELIATIELDDDRIVSWSMQRYQATEGHPRGVTAPAPPEFNSNINSVLLPFTSGIGRRTVRMTLRGRHSGGDPNSIWDVAEAGVVRSLGAAVDEASEIVAEYRRTHEQIMVQWRQGVRDAAVYAGMLGLREVAFWLIGGAVFRVLGGGLRVVAPRLYTLISPRTRVAAEYAETLFTRLLPAEKAELRALAARAETQGLEALTTLERARLDAIWRRMEQLISSPISQIEKGYLRTAMHGRYQAARAAEVAAFEAAGRAYQIHHRMPLEYGHLFPGFDVNTGSNLIGLDVTVHRGVNAVWTRFRTLPADRITPDAVSRVATIVDRHFNRWYHQVPPAPGLGTAVDGARDAALREVDLLVRALSR
ncbi:MAG TPA: DUF4157 domain-containing protein [Pyrinomonadaceae bacterium]|jgi:hypothetical protein|nr:DUF4157 domain-containing protein [Pyrinomonadaceae bacterium]